MQEQVLVFKEDPQHFIPKGHFWVKGEEAFNRWQNIVRRTKYYMERQQAENDETRKQIIPYCVLKDKSGKIFSYQRTKKGGESRLHDMYSIGIGGHVNPVDNFNIMNCAIREIQEETNFQGKLNANWIHKLGLIYDPSNAVGRVHFGAALVVHFPFDNVATQIASELTNPQWHTLEEISALNLENWSRFVVEMLDE